MILRRPLLMTVNISYIMCYYIYIYISWSCTGRRLINHVYVHVPQHYCLFYYYYYYYY